MSLSDAINAATSAVADAMREFSGDYWKFTVPGMRNSVDPYAFAMLVSNMMSEEADYAKRVAMRDYSFAQWKLIVDDEIDRRKISLPPEQPILHPDIKKPIPPASRTGAFGSGPFHDYISGPPTGGPLIPAPPTWLFSREREAWIQARVRGAEYVRGLGNIVETQTKQLVAEVWDGESIVSEVDLEARIFGRELIREEVSDALAHGRSARELARRLARTTEDWARDWDRIAITELQGAYNEGQVINAVRVSGPTARIARVPEQDACIHCKRLFLDADGRPKIFTAEALLANGTNVGRKAISWLPTIWPVHPNCRCDVQHIPEGLDFDKDWLLTSEVTAGRTTQTPDGLAAFGVGVL